MNALCTKAIFASVLITELIFSACSPQNQKNPPPIANVIPPIELTAPSVWKVLPKTPSEDDLRCANYSQKEWKVRLQDNALQIDLRKPREETNDPLPFKIKNGNTKNGLIGERHVKEVDDGWLVGFNAGEWGGSLYWFSKDGKEKRDLGALNTVGFIETSFGIFSVNGLAHLGSDTGYVLRIFKDNAGQWGLEKFVDLESAPHALTNELQGMFLVLTNKGLVRITQSQSVERLTQTSYSGLYPASMVRLSSGVVYAGMRLFVVRFIPDGNTYKEEWLLPSNCLKFRINDYDCRCQK